MRADKGGTWRNAEREQAIAEAAEQGDSLQTIATRHGITRQRVHQILVRIRREREATA